MDTITFVPTPEMAEKLVADFLSRAGALDGYEVIRYSLLANRREVVDVVEDGQVWVRIVIAPRA